MKLLQGPGRAASRSAVAKRCEHPSS